MPHESLNCFILIARQQRQSKMPEEREQRLQTRRLQRLNKTTLDKVMLRTALAHCPVLVGYFLLTNQNHANQYTRFALQNVHPTPILCVLIAFRVACCSYYKCLTLLSMVPDSVPIELARLSSDEERLISLICPFILPWPIWRRG